MSSIGRASVLIGAGTVVSRATGLLRSVVLVAAIGSYASPAADAFGLANQLPNTVYAIISAGLLSAIVVPQIIKAASHSDGGSAFVSKLFTLGTVVLLATTVLATVGAPWLVLLYGRDFPPETIALSTAFAYWCLPQILFYGLYALVGEALNARRVYGPFTWAPIVNNLVSIVGFVAFIVLFGGPVTAATEWTPSMILLLAGTATGGIVLQAIVLMLFWRKANLPVRPDFRWRGVGLNHIGRMAGWTFLMVIVGQIAGIVQSNVLVRASDVGASIAVWQNMWLLFMLPYSLIVISIGTPYFTQLSEHASAGRGDEVRGDIDRSIRTLGLFIVVATAAVAAAAVPASRIFTTSAEAAQPAALVLLAFLVSLIPLSVLFVVQRTFYAYNDTRTPFIFTAIQAALVITVTLIASAVVPIELMAAALALGQSLSSTIQVIIATWLLHRRLGGIGIRSWLPALGRFSLAAIPAGAVGWGVYLLFGGAAGWMVSGQLLGALGACVIGLVVLGVYLGLLALLRAPELAPAIALARRVLPGRR